MGAATNTQIKTGISDALLSATTDAERTRVWEACGFIQEFVFHKANADAALLTASEFVFARVTKKIQISNIQIIGAGAVAANNTNFATVELAYDDGLGGPDTVVAAQTTQLTGSGNWVAGTALGVPLSATPANHVVDGSVTPKFLILRIPKAGAGIVIPAFTLFLTAELVD